MPSIEESLKSRVDLSKYTPSEPTLPSNTLQQPITSRGIFLRCPIPPQGAISVDNLSQYERDFVIPQFRVLIGG